MNTQEIVAKLWNLCNVLRDDGITYHQYVTELTYILFLKMAKETGSEENIPEGYRWDDLLARKGLELKSFYKELLDYPSDARDVFRRFTRARRRTSTSRRTWKRLSGRLTSWTGSARRRRAWVIFTKDCWRKTLTKRRAAPGSTSLRVC